MCVGGYVCSHLIQQSFVQLALIKAPQEAGHDRTYYTNTMLAMIFTFAQHNMCFFVLHMTSPHDLSSLHHYRTLDTP